MKTKCLLPRSEKIFLIEKRLNTLIEQSTIHSEMKKAAFHTLAGGKKFRPLLTLTLCECLEGDIYKALDPACALEFVHTYSLIHDDLPSLDNDDFRRNQPTLHKLYDEAFAILAGDMFLTYAFEIISEAKQVDPTKKILLTTSLAKRAGGKGMIYGQLLDIESKKHPLTEESFLKICRKKTGELITCSLEFGAILANQEHFLPVIHQLGTSLGLAFQLVDDQLDKEKNETCSSLKILGEEKTQKEIACLYDECKQLVNELPLTCSSLEELIQELIFRKY